MSETLLPAKTAGSNPPGHDIFCTPENSDFISAVPYQSLSTTEREIRLLKILPDSGSGFVECELLPGVKLADVHEQYLALSYCAGSAKNTEPIKVNGAKCNVFANLHHALVEARHYWQLHADKQDLLLWVDQICINQFDLAERSHQVGFMRDIYENAEQTFICLSTPEAHGDQMKQLLELRDKLTPMNWRSSSEIIYQLHHKNVTTEELAKAWTASIEIVTSPWWGRAWVFQEYMVSTQTVFLYGGYSMRDSEFNVLLPMVSSADGLSIIEREFQRHIFPSLHRKDHMKRATYQMFKFLKAKLMESRTSDLKSLLLLTKDCQASDIRDKLYSILGLANPGYGITPNYSPNTDIQNLLVNTTKRIIIFEDSLEVLSYQACRNPPEPNERGLLPSWVLDWTRSASFSSFYENPYHLYEPINILNPGCSGIMAASADACFLQVPHPQHPEVRITVLQAWAVMLDNEFRTVTGHQDVFVGTQEYELVPHHVPVTDSDELWNLRGARDCFLLRKYYYGYQVIGPVWCTNLKDRLKLVPGIINSHGLFDMSKMQQTRITIF